MGYPGSTLWFGSLSISRSRPFNDITHGKEQFIQQCHAPICASLSVEWQSRTSLSGERVPGGKSWKFKDVPERREGEGGHSRTSPSGERRAGEHSRTSPSGERGRGEGIQGRPRVARKGIQGRPRVARGAHQFSQVLLYTRFHFHLFPNIF